MYAPASRWPYPDIYNSVVLNMEVPVPPKRRSKLGILHDLKTEYGHVTN